MKRSLTRTLKGRHIHPDSPRFPLVEPDQYMDKPPPLSKHGIPPTPEEDEARAWKATLCGNRKALAVQYLLEKEDKNNRLWYPCNRQCNRNYFYGTINRDRWQVVVPPKDGILSVNFNFLHKNGAPGIASERISFRGTDIDESLRSSLVEAAEFNLAGSRCRQQPKGAMVASGRGYKGICAKELSDALENHYRKNGFGPALDKINDVYQSRGVPDVSGYIPQNGSARSLRRSRAKWS